MREDDAERIGEHPVAVVTGANRGLGRETARQLLDRGYAVCVGSRDEQAGRDAAAELSQGDREVVPAALDVTDSAGVTALAELVRERWGGVDVVVNNAGISLAGFNADVARRTLAVNFHGAVRVTDTLLPHVREPGVIVMVSSGLGELSCLSAERRRELADEALTRQELLSLVAGFEADVAAGRHAERGWPSSGYRVSKVALNAFTRILARELREAGRDVIVNAVCPGWVRTDLGGDGAPRGVTEGARGITWAATRPAGSASGGFYRDGELIPW